MEVESPNEIVERDGVSGYTISRVDDGTGRSGDTTYAIAVDFAMSRDYGVDYTLSGPLTSVWNYQTNEPNWRITLPAGGGSAGVGLSAHNNAIRQDDRDVELSIVSAKSVNGAGCFCGSLYCGPDGTYGQTGPEATVTILDDDHWAIKVERTSAATIVERGPGEAQFTVTRVDDGSNRSGDLSYGILVDLAMSGLAEQYIDYNLSDDGGYLAIYGDKIVIEDGDTTATFKLTPENDHKREPDEDAVISVENGTSVGLTGGVYGADQSQGSDSVTILDDDWWDSTVSESDDEALEPCTWIPVDDRRGSFVVSRVPVDPSRADTSVAARVELEFSGTATPLGDFYGDDPRDYEILDASGIVIGAYEKAGGVARATVTIPVDQTTTVVYVQPHGDHIFEEIETVVATVVTAYCALSDGSDPDYLYGIGSPSTSGDVNIIQAPEFVSEVDGPFTGPRPINADSYHRLISARAEPGTKTYGDRPISAVAPAGRSFNYSIHSGNDEGLFQIDTTTGEISSVDFFVPEQTTYYLQIKVYDTAEEQLYDLATVSIVVLDLNTLTLTDGNDATNSVTDPAGNDKLYVLQQANGTAPIDIALTWTPDSMIYAGYMQWKLEGADLGDWDLTSGGFAGGPVSVTWTDPGSGSPNREFDVVAWADMNGDGQVDTDEPSRELELVVAKATFTVYADQPVAGDPTVVYDWSNDEPGHSFWRVTLVPAAANGMLPSHLLDELSQSWGFYPVSGDLKPKVGDITAPGFVRNDSGHDYDSKLAVPLGVKSQLLNILEYTHDLRATPGNYNIETRNCTDIAIAAAGIIGLALPDCNGDVYDENGEFLITCSCPAVLGEELIALGGERHP